MQLQNTGSLFCKIIRKVLCDNVNNAHCTCMQEELNSLILMSGCSRPFQHSQNLLINLGPRISILEGKLDGGGGGGGVRCVFFL